ncbi:MAG: hypothetical protein AB7T63_08745 [Planctomycetota bacterium]
MNVWKRGLLALASAFLVACGGGGSVVPGDSCEFFDPDEFDDSPLGRQVDIEVRFLTVSRTRLDAMRLDGLEFPNLAAIMAGAPTNMGGTNCGPSTGVDANVVGGAMGEVVIVPEGHAGQQTLPLVRPLPFMQSVGAQVYTNYPGPGSFAIDLADRRGLGMLNPIPGGQIITPHTGVPASSIMYALTDGAGANQFISEAFEDAGTRQVVAPMLRSYFRQTATVFVPTETVAFADMDPQFAARGSQIHNALGTLEMGPVLRMTATVPASNIISLVLEPALQAAQATLPDPFDLDGTSASQAQLLITRSRQVSATVLVPDGATLILGGLRNNATMIETTGLPLFSDLPVLGSHVFANNQLNATDHDLIIMIRPTILH